MDTPASLSPAVAHQAPVPLPIRILRRLKPLVVGLLRSPVHGLLSREILVLSWTGRRSGRRFELPLSYVPHAGALYLCTRPDGSTWWRHLRPAARVALVLAGRRVAADAVLVDPTSREALDALRAFVTRNPRTGVTLYQVAREAGAPKEDDLAREVLRSVVVRLDVAPDGPQAARSR